ncbi:MAG: dephospho-CoA kinase [Planctomycetales bacterium]
MHLRFLHEKAARYPPSRRSRVRIGNQVSERLFLKPRLAMKNAVENSLIKKTIPVIGFVGGIGSGKSYLAQNIAEKHPVDIIDADRIGHEVLTLPEVRAQLLEKFGDEIFLPTGEVNRRKLGLRVFGPLPCHQAARKDLESIVHPQIREKIEQRIREIRQAGQSEAVILDAAILLESGWKTSCQALVYVDVPEEERLQRVISSRNWTPEEFFAREAQQLPLEYKQVVADYCVNNSSTAPAPHLQVLQIYSNIMDEFSR